MAPTKKKGELAPRGCPRAPLPHNLLSLFSASTGLFSPTCSPSHVCQQRSLCGEASEGQPIPQGWLGCPLGCAHPSCWALGGSCWSPVQEIPALPAGLFAGPQPPQTSPAMGSGGSGRSGRRARLSALPTSSFPQEQLGILSQSISALAKHQFVATGAVCGKGLDFYYF